MNFNNFSCLIFESKTNKPKNTLGAKYPNTPNLCTGQIYNFQNYIFCHISRNN